MQEKLLIQPINTESAESYLKSKPFLRIQNTGISDYAGLEVIFIVKVV